jgi:hypothetical protein
MGPEDLRLWGTFEIDLTDLGVFAGSWASGHAVGKADDGRLIKVDLDPPEFDALQSFPGCDAGFEAFSAIYTVIDPGK